MQKKKKQGKKTSFKKKPFFTTLSVTGGERAEINFGGAREAFIMWIGRGHGGTRSLFDVD